MRDAAVAKSSERLVKDCRWSRINMKFDDDDDDNSGDGGRRDRRPCSNHSRYYRWRNRRDTPQSWRRGKLVISIFICSGSKGLSSLPHSHLIFLSRVWRRSDRHIRHLVRATHASWEPHQKWAKRFPPPLMRSKSYKIKRRFIAVAIKAFFVARFV